MLGLMRSEVRAGRQDCVPGESLLQRMLAGFDWEARSRMIEGPSGLEGAVLVAGRSTPEGVVTQVSVAAIRTDLRHDLLKWGFGLSKASGAVAAQVWTGRGHSDGLAQLGAALVRPWWRMDLDISDRLPNAQPVAGYELRDGSRVGPGGWSDVHNRSFADHWRFSPRQEVELVTGRPPHLSLMATAPDGAPAAVTLAHVESYIEDSRPQPVGIVSSVGTVPEHRRKGLATWLVAEALCRLQAEGARSASLYVDGWNHTRAFDAYSKLGFALAFESEVWEANLR
ncbi:MAG TPA: GNAT family N-acetyltransferase [Methylomirabilota bacterium]|nr:GNAT family N-acetyltransferase [Methylomirabilota bacterium]